MRQRIAQNWRERRGLTTKIHLLANTDKKPLDFVLTGGEASDAKEGATIIKKNLGRIKKLLADKAYDSDGIRSQLKSDNKEACIPRNPIEKIQLPMIRSCIKNEAISKLCSGV